MLIDCYQFNGTPGRLETKCVPLVRRQRPGLAMRRNTDTHSAPQMDCRSA